MLKIIFVDYPKQILKFYTLSNTLFNNFSFLNTYSHNFSHKFFLIFESKLLKICLFTRIHHQQTTLQNRLLFFSFFLHVANKIEEGLFDSSFTLHFLSSWSVVLPALHFIVFVDLECFWVELMENLQNKYRLFKIWYFCFNLFVIF